MLARWRTPNSSPGYRAGFVLAGLNGLSRSPGTDVPPNVFPVPVTMHTGSRLFGLPQVVIGHWLVAARFPLDVPVHGSIPGAGHHANGGWTRPSKGLAIPEPSECRRILWTGHSADGRRQDVPHGILRDAPGVEHLLWAGGSPANRNVVNSKFAAILVPGTSSPPSFDSPGRTHFCVDPGFHPIQLCPSHPLKR